MSTGPQGTAHCWVLLGRGREWGGDTRTWSLPWLMQCIISCSREGGNPRGPLSIAQREAMQPVLYAVEEEQCAPQQRKCDEAGP